MTDSDLDALELMLERGEKATRGRWNFDDQNNPEDMLSRRGRLLVYTLKNGTDVADTPVTEQGMADAYFVVAAANARDALRALLAEARAR